MVTKKIRTEYMKKFRDPKWETFSKCYEDSLKYRLTRRVMEHSHKPWFWEGWDSGSDSSGWSTPRPTRNKIAPLSLPPPTSSEAKLRSPSRAPEPPPQDGDAELGAAEAADVDAAPPAGGENGMNEASGSSVTSPPDHGRPDDTETDNGPADTASSDGEPVNPAPRRRHHRRTPRSEPGHQDASARKPPRAKSQPAISSKENRRPSSRLDWSERQAAARRTPNDTRRESDKRTSDPQRRRARSADLEKMRRSQLTVVEDRWVTEYMRCFSARLR